MKVIIFVWCCCIGTDERMLLLWAIYACPVADVAFGEVAQGLETHIDNMLYVSSGAVQVSFEFMVCSDAAKHESVLDGDLFSLRYASI